MGLGRYCYLPTRYVDTVRVPALLDQGTKKLDFLQYWYCTIHFEHWDPNLPPIIKSRVAVCIHMDPAAAQKKKSI